MGVTRRVRAKCGAARPVERAARDRPRSAPALRAGWAALSSLSPQAATVGSPAPRLPPPAPPQVLLPRRVHAPAPPGPAPPDRGRCCPALEAEAPPRAPGARERWAAGEQRLARKPCCRLWCRRPRPRARGCSRTWRYLPSATSLLCKRMPPFALQPHNVPQAPLPAPPRLREPGALHRGLPAPTVGASRSTGSEPVVPPEVSAIHAPRPTVTTPSTAHAVRQAGGRDERRKWLQG